MRRLHHVAPPPQILPRLRMALPPLLTMPLLLMLAACSGGAKDDEAAAAKPADPVAEVHSAAAVAGAAAATVTVYGVAEAGAGGERTLIAPVEATVARVLVPSGGAVAAGQAVVVLTPGPAAQLDLGKARSDAGAATAALARARRLRADGLMSDADVETARAAAQVATTIAASLGARGALLTLRAPVAGTVTTIGNAPGDLVPAGTAVVHIAARGGLRARFGIEPQRLGRLHVGETVTVRDGAGGTPATARITAIDTLVDPATRLASVFTTLPPFSRAGAGEPLSASLALGGDIPGVTVPEAALGDDAGKAFVYVIAGGVAHKRDVSAGPVTDGRAAVTRGLNPGERVAVDGLTGLEDGIKVREPAAVGAHVAPSRGGR